jgi:hypothetical protein
MTFRENVERTAASFAQRCASVASRILAPLVGRWHWQAPGWLTWLGYRLKAAWRYFADSPVVVDGSADCKVFRSGRRFNVAKERAIKDTCPPNLL